MMRRINYKIVAAFLLLVFSLNTIAGFACSVGIDLGYNSKHHPVHETIQAVAHIHQDGKKHIHFEKQKNSGHKTPHEYNTAYKY